MPEVVVVALDINREDIQFDEFERLSGEAKIEFIKNRIDAISKELSEKKPDAMWLITWREYGITGSGPESRSIPNSLKKQFKEAMQELTRTYANLSVLAGTVSTQKHFDDSSKLAEIRGHYAGYDRIKQEEAVSGLTSDKQIAQQESKIDELMTKQTNGISPEQSLKETGIDILRNTCYFFSGGDAEVQRHDKTTPYNETLHNIEYPEAIFQPGKGRNKSAILDVDHVKMDGRPLRFGVEICREHEFHVLKTELDQIKAGSDKYKHGNTLPLIHFVLSDTMNLKPENMCGEYIIQLDSINKPRLICNQTVPSDVTVVLYQNNLLKQDAKLIGPLQPIHLFEKRILAEFDYMIGKFPTTDRKRQLLQMIKDKFIISTDSLSVAPMYLCLNNNFKNEMIKDVLFKKETGLFSSFTSLFFNEAPDLRPWVNNILKMVKEEKRRNPNYKDYIAHTDSTLLTTDFISKTPRVRL